MRNPLTKSLVIAVVSISAVALPAGPLSVLHMAAGGSMWCPSGSTAVAGDLKQAAPADAFLAVYSVHNSERDYLKQHYEEVWNAARDSQVFERIVRIIQSRGGEANAEQFLAVRDALENALAPIDWDAVRNISEILYVQRMEPPTSQHVLLMQIPDGGAASLQQACRNLFRLAEQATGGVLMVVEDSIADFSTIRLRLPPGVPFEPIVGVGDSLLLFATSAELAGDSLRLLNGAGGESKFDDPRFDEAFEQLPAAEDSIVIFDGHSLMSQLRGLVPFIQQVSNDSPDAARAAALLEKLFEQLDAVDYEVTVEYTKGYQNRTATFGRLKSGGEQSMAGMMFVNQQLFSDWSRWVPADAQSFSLTGGLTVRPLYLWLMDELPKQFPEVRPALDRFAAIQKQYDLHLDEDLLQAFSGESISLQFPGKTPSPLGQSTESVLMLRCSKPERIQELLHRGINALQEIPQVRAQGIGLKPAAGLEGFEELTAGIMAITGMRPVIGFHDGWMVLGSHPGAVQRVLKSLSGEGASFAESETFGEFNLEVEGAVQSISFANTGESIRQTAQGLQQAGTMLPIFLAMAGQSGGGPDLSLVQDIVGMLPAVGRIAAKLDFIEQKLSVTQPGPTPGTWVRQSVVRIRPPVDEL